jgi:hypothetical protein
MKVIYLTFCTYSSPTFFPASARFPRPTLLLPKVFVLSLSLSLSSLYLSLSLSLSLSLVSTSLSLSLSLTLLHFSHWPRSRELRTTGWVESGICLTSQGLDGPFFENRLSTNDYYASLVLTQFLLLLSAELDRESRNRPFRPSAAAAATSTVIDSLLGGRNSLLWVHMLSLERILLIYHCSPGHKKFWPNTMCVCAVQAQARTRFIDLRENEIPGKIFKNTVNIAVIEKSKRYSILWVKIMLKKFI